MYEVNSHQSESMEVNFPETEEEEEHSGNTMANLPNSPCSEIGRSACANLLE